MNLLSWIRLPKKENRFAIGLAAAPSLLLLAGIIDVQKSKTEDDSSASSSTFLGSDSDNDSGSGSSGSSSSGGSSGSKPSKPKPKLKFGCETAFRAAAQVDPMHDTLEDMYPMFDYCTTIEQWKLGDKAFPDAVDGVAIRPLVDTMCSSHPALKNAVLCLKLGY